MTPNPLVYTINALSPNEKVFIFKVVQIHNTFYVSATFITLGIWRHQVLYETIHKPTALSYTEWAKEQIELGAFTVRIPHEITFINKFNQLDERDKNLVHLQ
jgi:hypothetical protein